MKRPHERRRLEPEASPASPWLEAAVRATDPHAFLMSLGETEFAVLLAELDARRCAEVAARMPGHPRRNRSGKRTPSPRPG